MAAAKSIGAELGRGDLQPAVQDPRLRRRRDRVLRVACVGEYVVDAADHALREVSLGDDAAYRIADFPAHRRGSPQQ